MQDFVNTFSYTADILAGLKQSISTERLTSYLEHTEGRWDEALHLYTWNTSLSSAFYGPLQALEITLRNALARELSEHYGPEWYDEPGCGFDHECKIRIQQAKERVRRKHDLETARIISELSFGFWVSLLGSGGEQYNYEMTLWRPALYKAFPHVRQKRKQTHGPLNYLRKFRNRIAHHEPIFKRHLAKDYQSIVEVTRWICPATSLWIEHHSRIENILKRNTNLSF